MSGLAGEAVRVAPVGAADAPALKRFMAEVIAASVTTEEPLYSDTVANTHANVDWWLARQDDAVHLKAVMDGRLMGVVLVKQFWNLCSLFVDPVAQGRGIGRRLVQAAHDECRGRSPKDAVWLNAAPSAVTFYERLGYVSREPSKPLPPGFRAMARLL